MSTHSIRTRTKVISSLMSCAAQRWGTLKSRLSRQAHLTSSSPATHRTRSGIQHAIWSRHIFRPNTPTRQSHSLAATQETESDRLGNTRTLSSQLKAELLEEERRFSAHLNRIFPSLDFPPELARRILTHGSHKAAVDGHNGRFSFIGRRVLESYLLLFLHSVSTGAFRHDYESIVSRVLNTYLLGEHVAPNWSLGSILRWVPTVSADVMQTSDPSHREKRDVELGAALAANPHMARSIGLYKVMGDSVQAVMGGIYHQFGGTAAHCVFHTRVLPHLLLSDQSEGLPQEFHTRALDFCRQMGGPAGNILRPSSSSFHGDAVNYSPNPGAAREEHGSGAS